MRIGSFTIFYFIEKYKEIADIIKNILLTNMQEKDDGGLVIVIGGDGTFLYAQNKFKNKYFIGINPDPLRSVGFYMILSNKTLHLLKEVLEGKYRVVYLPRLFVNNNYALNEVQIYPIPADKLLKIKVRISLKNGKIIETYEKNSGVIIYTPTGSFGFARNLEGALGLNSIGLVAIAPFDGLLKDIKSLTIPLSLFDEIYIESSKEFLVSLDSRDRFTTKKLKIKIGKSLKYIVPYSALNFEYTQYNIGFFVKHVL